MRKIFTDNLPKRNNGNILWCKSIGQEIEFIYDDTNGKFLILDYFRKDKKYVIKLEYNGKVVETDISDFSHCYIQKIIGYKRSHKYLYNIGDIFNDDNRNLEIIGFKNKPCNRKDGKSEIKYGYIFKCNICGWDNGWISETLLKNGGGCSCCASKTVVHGINDITTTSPWMIDYFQGGYEEASLYTKCASKKMFFKCPHCNKISNKQISITNLYAHHGFTCTCSDSLSRIAKYIRTLLDLLKEDYQINEYDTEVKFDWCKFYNPFKRKECIGIYDFVIHNKNLIIEADGGFHRRDNPISGQTVEESKYIDKQKDKLAKDNGYTIIRISDEYDIKESILNSNLSNIFNLNNIDWIKCDLGSLSNYFIYACTLKRENPDMSTSEIAKKLKLGSTTVRRWLTDGSAKGFCTYNPECEKSRSLECKGGIEKTIICINNGMIFVSGVDLVNQSEKIFGYKLSTGNVSTCCNRKIDNINGYIFRFINDLTKDEQNKLAYNLNKIKLEKVNESILEYLDKIISQDTDIHDSELLELCIKRNNLLKNICA